MKRDAGQMALVCGLESGSVLHNLICIRRDGSSKDIVAELLWGSPPPRHASNCSILNDCTTELRASDGFGTTCTQGSPS